ncbi:hypothetical protein CUS26_15335, partial [Enterococcus faecalis]
IFGDQVLQFLVIYHLEIDEIGALRSRYCSSSNHYVLRDSQQFRLIPEGPSPSRYDDFICSCFTVKHRNS